MPTLAQLAARLLLALLSSGDGRRFLTALAALLAMPLLLALSLPTVLLHVPLADTQTLAMYTRVAEEVRESTGVTVDWQVLVAIDAVRYEQDFSRVTLESIRALANRFLERHERTVDCGAEPNCVPRVEVTYKLRSLSAVLAELHFSAEQQQLVSTYLATLRAAEADSSTPDGWLPVEAGGWVWPVPGYTRITSHFGPRIHPVTGRYSNHFGTDIAVPEGTPVRAAHAGRVVSAGWAGACGIHVRIEWVGGAIRYCHLSAVTVPVGAAVSAGDVVALSGNTGRSTGPHLHFERYENGRLVDPLAPYRSTLARTTR